MNQQTQLPVVSVQSLVRLDIKQPSYSVTYPWDGHVLDCRNSINIQFGISATAPNKQKEYEAIVSLCDEQGALLDYTSMHLVIPDNCHVLFEEKQCEIRDGGDVCLCAGMTWFHAPSILVNRSNMEHDPAVWNQCGLIVMRYQGRLWIKIRDGQSQFT